MATPLVRHCKKTGGLPVTVTEKVAGKLANTVSSSVLKDQWRICFRWREGNSYKVEIVDYH